MLAEQKQAGLYEVDHVGYKLARKRRNELDTDITMDTLVALKGEHVA